MAEQRQPRHSKRRRKGDQVPAASVEEVLITRHEAARRLSVHYNTIRQMEARGELTATPAKIGSIERVGIPLSEVERIMAEKRQAQRPTAEAEKRIAALEAELRSAMAVNDDLRRERDKLTDRLFNLLAEREKGS